MRITKNATQVHCHQAQLPLLVCARAEGLSTSHVLQSSGISLQLAAANADSLPQNYTLREQTDNITPTVVFADLQGRLSKHCRASKLTAMQEGSPGDDEHGWSCSGAEGRVKRKFDLVMSAAQVRPAFHQG